MWVRCHLQPLLFEPERRLSGPVRASFAEQWVSAWSQAHQSTPVIAYRPIEHRCLRPDDADQLLPPPARQTNQNSRTPTRATHRTKRSSSRHRHSLLYLSAIARNHHDHTKMSSAERPILPSRTIARHNTQPNVVIRHSFTLVDSSLPRNSPTPYVR